MKTNRFWIIVIAVILLVSCAASAVVYLYNGVGSIVGIYQNGELVKEIHLDTVTTPYTFVVDSADGGYNEITVEQNRICVSDASCPDHVCVETGWLSDGVIPIVCLPNELVIQIVNGNSDGVDIAVQ